MSKARDWTRKAKATQLCSRPGPYLGKAKLTCYTQYSARVKYFV